MATITEQHSFFFNVQDQINDEENSQRKVHYKIKKLLSSLQFY